jgi:hypothetical protein
MRSGKEAGEVTFRDFVYFVCDKPQNRLNGHWAPQTQLLMLDLIKYDFIGRFEFLQRDLSHVLDKLGAPAELKERAQIRVNSSLQIHPDAAFDGETADWVYDVYREDFVNFGYERDSWQLRDEV